ncbi:hypothetical protein HYQ46_001779 [Verticillium longisporum]|nr:hypothetical protein HYQ46_001779 [Verticillium longisporum]
MKRCCCCSRMATSAPWTSVRTSKASLCWAARLGGSSTCCSIIWVISGMGRKVKNLRSRSTSSSDRLTR